MAQLEVGKRLFLNSAQIIFFSFFGNGVDSLLLFPTVCDRKPRTKKSKIRFFFFYQNDLHVLLTKQFHKINCEIIEIKINREKAFNKKMTKHIQNLNNIFWMLRQWWKSRIK